MPQMIVFVTNSFLTKAREVGNIECKKKIPAKKLFFTFRNFIFLHCISNFDKFESSNFRYDDRLLKSHQKNIPKARLSCKNHSIPILLKFRKYDAIAVLKTMILNCFNCFIPLLWFSYACLAFFLKAIVMVDWKCIKNNNILKIFHLNVNSVLT